MSYSYSFFQDDRVDLAVSIGVYVMPIDFGVKVSGVLDEGGSEKFTAPLPVFGLRLEAEGEDWPGIDLKGNVEFNYAGVQLYLRLFY